MTTTKESLGMTYLDKIDYLADLLKTMSVGSSITVISYRGMLTFTKAVLDDDCHYYKITGKDFYSACRTSWLAARKAYH